MNERIKELAEQSGIVTYFSEISGCEQFLTGNVVKLDKFSELIINECLDIVDKEVLGMVGVRCMKKIEEHFGVE